MSNKYDVAVVGAGFAGLIAARELAMRGRSVLLSDARDRLGGRTWTDHRLGRDLEMGGTWVHWAQPHTWSEITRYGIEVEPSPTPDRVLWNAGQGVHETTREQFAQLVGPGQEHMLADTRRYFDNPYKPLVNPDIKEIDTMSVLDRLRSADLEPEIFDLQAGIWAEHFNAPAELCAYTQAMRWCAAASGSRQLMDEASSGYRIVGGTTQLVTAIANDTVCDVSLQDPLLTLHSNDSGGKLVFASGEVHADRIIVAVGLNALRTINFDPGLPPLVRESIEQGSASRGLKVWIKIRGPQKPFAAYGGRDYKLTFVRTEYFDKDATTLVAFGPDVDRLDCSSVKDVSEALGELGLDYEVLSVESHDWVNDRWSGATWPMQQPDQLTRYLATLQEPHGNVILASSDIANGWAGFIDGAIESGLHAARWALSKTG